MLRGGALGCSCVRTSARRTPSFFLEQGGLARGAVGRARVECPSGPWWRLRRQSTGLGGGREERRSRWGEARRARAGRRRAAGAARAEPTLPVGSTPSRPAAAESADRVASSPRLVFRLKGVPMWRGGASRRGQQLFWKFQPVLPRILGRRTGGLLEVFATVPGNTG